MSNVDLDVYLALLRKLQGMDAVAQARMKIVREASATEQDAEYHKPGYGLFFCVHAKHMFSPCRACKRSEAEGNDRRDRFVNKVIS